MEDLVSDGRADEITERNGIINRTAGTEYKGDTINYNLINLWKSDEENKDLVLTVFSERTPLTGNTRRKAAKKWMDHNELEILQPKSGSTIEREDGARKGTMGRTRIGGRMEFFIEAWEKIGGAKLIKQGVHAMWKSKHMRKKLRDMPFRDGAVHSNEEQRKAFADLLKEQIETGIVEEIRPEEVRHRNNVFLIKKKSGAWRQILDCRRLNAALIKTHFKCDNEKTVERVLRGQDYAVTVYLQQAYYLLPVSKDLRPFFAFRFSGKDHTLKGMLFGFVDAPSIFTHAMRKVTSEIRKRWDVRVIAYIDDFLMFHENKEHFAQVSKEIIELLKELGQLENQEKSQLIPSRRFSFLGFECDSSKMKVRLARDRREALIRLSCLKEND
ncbi:putative Reverse transcriptase (RNA-dependent DNA polymerase) [Monocercomonoides exilis]|uniref:putative Reverse transcriptase (RNA-dependent DNA polymerase) n=1 Tax=Monocercomonoides exilis TaxID=2049356 RepID=UPI00355998AA|nr:putative Reverse transcriptase (RNA-dependent DNA polymerase) [Monocercomonoides exilis]|eukprot:MONOS_13607.1-p1 / transcript=MONOS_13607.1 / gene=MONOS_13607 / organism=Monocercomonoides_exilis_PA203 / gene_product=reverse transcriptase / transcript_product=reverse transcriptase / location=Mono_scaffold00853:10945-12180(-) / protein_length=384 / sequence_SO=supercontig / SO=protein_coding / is_pseudo=false